MHSCGVVTLTIDKMSDKEEDKQLDPEVDEEEEGDTDSEFDDSSSSVDDITEEGGKVNVSTQTIKAG